MSPDEFDKVVARRIQLIQSVLASKRKEYAGPGKDRLHNFTRAGAALGTTRPKALVGMWMKHIVSVLDIVDDYPTTMPTVEMIEEKIGDSINYLILLEAMLKDDFNQGG